MRSVEAMSMSHEVAMESPQVDRPDAMAATAEDQEMAATTEDLSDECHSGAI